MHYKIAWIGLAADMSCTRYRQNCAFTLYMLQSCELSAHENRHVFSKISDAIAGFADTPPVVMCVSREREDKEKQRAVCIVTLYVLN